jgi:hypothetical protein
MLVQCIFISVESKNIGSVIVMECCRFNLITFLTLHFVSLPNFLMAQIVSHHAC